MATEFWLDDSGDTLPSDPSTNLAMVDYDPEILTHGFVDSEPGVGDASVTPEPEIQVGVRWAHVQSTATGTTRLISVKLINSAGTVTGSAFNVWANFPGVIATASPNFDDYLPVIVADSWIPISETLEGYDGGLQGAAPLYAGGGGGGAGGVGGPGSSYPGNGGAGTPSDFNNPGSATTWSTGGRSGRYPVSPPAGPAGTANEGEGGKGANCTVPQGGTASTGGSGYVSVKEGPSTNASGVWNMNDVYDNVKNGTWSS